MKTTRLGIIIFLLLAVLTACAPADTKQPDLYAEAQAARATADASQAQAQFQERFLTATAEAPIIRITETASALIVLQTQAAFQKTETAAQWTATPSPTPTPNLTATMAVSLLQAQQTELANNTARDNLALERQRSMNQFWGMLPAVTFTIIALAFIMGLVWISRIMRYRPVRMDARGNPIPVMDIVDGQVTDVDRNPNYRGSMRNDSIIEQWLRVKLQLPAPQPLLTAERQDATTQRDQMVDLATRGLPGNNNPVARKAAGTEMARLTAKQSAPIQIEMVPPDEIRGWLNDVQGQLSERVEEDT